MTIGDRVAMKGDEQWTGTVTSIGKGVNVVWDHQPDAGEIECWPDELVTITIRRYPVSGHATKPARCARCAARVFDYSTETHTVDGKMIARHHYCPPCERVRGDK